MRLRSVFIRKDVGYYILIYLSVIIIYSLIFIILMERFENKQPDFLTGLYWVITMMTTTGLGDIFFVSNQGRIFTIVVEITGVIMVFALMFPLIITPWLENRIKSATIDNPPEKIKDHVIICGCNALVESLIDDLQKKSIPFVIIDTDDRIIKTLAAKDIFCIFGNPSDATTLKQASIGSARFLIANRKDEENADIVLTASKITRGKIIALVEDMKMARYLEYAGANHVISPKQMLGISFGKKAAVPWSSELLGTVEVLGDLKIAELSISHNPEIVNRPLRESKIRKLTGATIIALWQDGELLMNPPPDTILRENSMLVALGSEEQLRACSNFTAGCRSLNSGKHIIIAGYGDVGRQVAKILRSQNIPYIVVDKKALGDEKQVIGDAADETSLEKANINSASILVVTLNDDSSNIYTTLIARKMNPDLHIIVRANLESSISKLYRAGADYVLSLSRIGGKMLTKLIEEGKLPDEGTLFAEKIRVYKAKAKALSGKTISDSLIRPATGCTVIGIEKEGKFIANPDPKTIITRDSTLIVIGTEEQVGNFEKKFNA